MIARAYGHLLPYAELLPGAAVRAAIKWQVVGLLLLASHIILTKQNVALFPLALLLMGWLYANAPLAGLLVYLQFLIYQNWMIALLSAGMEPFTFTLLQGSNFAAIALLAVIAFTRLITPAWKRATQPFVTAFVVALAVSLVYIAIGAAREGPTSAIVYFREFIGPAFGMIVGLDVGRSWGYRSIAIGVLVSTILSIIVAIVEIMMPHLYYDWINAADFANLKAACCVYKLKLYSATDVVEQNTATLFNISGYEDSGNLMSFRFMSTAMHPISYAYVLAVFSLIAISLRRTYWLVLTVPLMILVGVKGAVLLLLCSLFMWGVWMLSARPRLVVIMGLALMVAYVGYGIIRGIDVADYHVIGFLGGVHGFVANPLGHGLGVGGNLSAMANEGFKWTGAGGFQTAGADFALESAVGVLIYQMGIGSLAIFAIFFVMLKAAPFVTKARPPRLLDLWYIAVATVMVNGVFQEEAYAPAAAGLIALLCAIVIVNGERTAVRITGHGFVRYKSAPALAS